MYVYVYLQTVNLNVPFEVKSQAKCLIINIYILTYMSTSRVTCSITLKVNITLYLLTTFFLSILMLISEINVPYDFIYTFFMLQFHSGIS